MTGKPRRSSRDDDHTIVVVDDQPIQLKGIVAEIKDAHPQWRVLTAGTEAETIALIRASRNNPPSLVSVDLGLATDPSGWSEGLALLQRLGQEYKGIPLMAHSAQNVTVPVIRQLMGIPASYVRITDSVAGSNYVAMLPFVANQYLILSPSVRARVPEAVVIVPDPLDYEQWSTAKRLHQKMSYAQIAAEDSVQPTSIEARVRGIVRILVDQGLIDSPNDDDPQHNRNAVAAFYVAQGPRYGR